jgi:aryl-alcohol dehydrogenase-like predicted oxidoreductase
MEYVRLGRTGLRVSPLCMGTMNFGPFATDQESFRIMDRAWELGINFFDTANVYGRDKGKGYSEQVIGRWFERGGGRREDIVLATKVYGRMGDGPNERGLSARHIRQACEASLKRLRTDYIDLYQMHHVDRDAPWDEIWQEMDRLVDAGKVLYVGSSNFAGWHIATACEAATRRGFLGLVSEQSLYNLTERTVELEVLPACEHYGLGVIPWSPLAGGALGGILEKSERAGRSGDDWVSKILERHGEAIGRYEAFCRELGHAPAAVALAWLLAQPAVTAPIIGPRTLDHLETSLAAFEVAFDEETLRALDEIWPGPGGPAPEAYAW